MRTFSSRVRNDARLHEVVDLPEDGGAVVRAHHGLAERHHVAHVRGGPDVLVREQKVLRRGRLVSRYGDDAVPRYSHDFDGESAHVELLVRLPLAYPVRETHPRRVLGRAREEADTRALGELLRIDAERPTRAGVRLRVEGARELLRPDSFFA
jgi:hypothetical protein